MVTKDRMHQILDMVTDLNASMAGACICFGVTAYGAEVVIRTEWNGKEFRHEERFEDDRVLGPIGDYYDAGLDAAMTRLQELLALTTRESSQG